ncbi:protein disulfide oxidoreductase [Oceanimonas sp. CHS3-5]|uniref:protein disulfide oxidoreductase n=1 Tax=Oceanimonas sp. CHS3-5 TaxID=3068186 RepID=UPI00273E65C6|nr:protein disulfide oxidoreductase [Oceanimonas sp. CHS3-5]MDP5292651.1 protein disulfide oxidoreductase [Oceanimonas sp. CHS3-5]
MRSLTRWLGYGLVGLVLMTAVDLWRSRDLPASAGILGEQITLKGQAVDLAAQSHSEPVLLYVWASWCGICRLVSPMVNLVPGPVMSIAIASGSDARVTAYMRGKGYDFAVINDADNRLARSLSIGVTPTLMVVHQGELKLATTGFTTLPGMLLRRWLISWL